MAETTQFELVSPERLLFSEPVEMVVVPASEGDIGALPRHSPLMTALRPGVIQIYQGGKVQERIFVGGGFAEITETRVTVLAEDAIKISEAKKEDVASRILAAQKAIEEADGETARGLAQRQLAVANALNDALDAKLAH